VRRDFCVTFSHRLIDSDWETEHQQVDTKYKRYKAHLWCTGWHWHKQGSTLDPCFNSTVPLILPS
jgi:hypothetical protein